LINKTHQKVLIDFYLLLLQFYRNNINLIVARTISNEMPTLIAVMTLEVFLEFWTVGTAMISCMAETAEVRHIIPLEVNMSDICLFFSVQRII
jgi:hypothetical protein